MVKNEHVRVVHGTAFPLTLLRFEVLIKPFLISQAVFAGAAIVTARISLIVFAINRPFTGTAINLESIFSKRTAVKLARVFAELAAAALLHDAGLSYGTHFCHRPFAFR